jgi:hypothetical protein
LRWGGERRRGEEMRWTFVGEEVILIRRQTTRGVFCDFSKATVQI